MTRPLRGSTASTIVRPAIRKLNRRWPAAGPFWGGDGGPASKLGRAGGAATLPSSVDLGHTDNPVLLGQRLGIIATRRTWRNMDQGTTVLIDPRITSFFATPHFQAGAVRVGHTTNRPGCSLSVVG